MWASLYILDYKLSLSWYLQVTILYVVYFDQQMHAQSIITKKVTFSSCVREAHVRLMKKNGEKKFVGQWLGVTPKSWLTPKRWLLIWNFVVFCSFFYMGVPCAWRKMFSEKLCYSSLIYWIEPVTWCEFCTPYSSKTKWTFKTTPVFQWWFENYTEKKTYGPKCPVFRRSGRLRNYTIWVPDTHDGI